MTKLFQITFLILFIAGYCFYLNRYSFIVVKPPLGIEESVKYYDYKGITHVHSMLSTGSGTPSEIVKIAQDSKIDFLIFTEVNVHDHGQPLEGHFNNVTVLDGGEYSYLDSRLLYYGAPPRTPPLGKGQAQVYFADLLSQHPRSDESGFVVLAHPLLSRHAWTGEIPVGLDGIEVINLKRVLELAWREKLVESIWSILTYPFNPHLSLLRIYRDPQPELELWDRLSQKRRVVGLAGADATAKAILLPGTFLKFPSYATTFSVASNHVLLKSELTGDFQSDKTKILSALKEGQFYIALDILGETKGFWMEMTSQKKTYTMGSQVPFNKDTRLHISLPSQPMVPFEVRIFKDGELLATSNATDTTLNVTSQGVYRAVVRVLLPLPFPEGQKWIPWIYTNPFYVH